MIAIIDYGVGNVQAFLNLYKFLGFKAYRASNSKDLNIAQRIVLPGVGHFDHAMNKLVSSGMITKLEELVMFKKLPIIGICVGMQMLAESSEEGDSPGLNWLPGKVRAFKNYNKSFNLPTPHMGWNNLIQNSNSRLFSKGFENGAQFYFLHSFFFDCTDKENVVAKANYGFDFDAVVSCDNVHGIQCHPEKSHHWGFQLLKNFAEI